MTDYSELVRVHRSKDDGTVRGAFHRSTADAIEALQSDLASGHQVRDLVWTKRYETESDFWAGTIPGTNFFYRAYSEEEKRQAEKKHRQLILAALTPAPDAVDVSETPYQSHQTGLLSAETQQAPDAAPAPGIAEAAKVLLDFTKDGFHGHPAWAKAVQAYTLRNGKVRPVALFEAWIAALRAMQEEQ